MWTTPSRSGGADLDKRHAFPSAFPQILTGFLGFRNRWLHIRTRRKGGHPEVQPFQKMWIVVPRWGTVPKICDKCMIDPMKSARMWAHPPISDQVARNARCCWLVSEKLCRWQNASWREQLVSVGKKEAKRNQGLHIYLQYLCLVSWCSMLLPCCWC